MAEKGDQSANVITVLMADDNGAEAGGVNLSFHEFGV